MFPLTRLMCCPWPIVPYRTSSVHTVRVLRTDIPASEGRPPRPRRVIRLPRRFVDNNAELSVEGGSELSADRIHSALVHDVAVCNNTLEVLSWYLGEPFCY